MQIWAESGKSALPICNYSQILYQFLTFTQNLKRSQMPYLIAVFLQPLIFYSSIISSFSSETDSITISFSFLL